MSIGNQLGISNPMLIAVGRFEDQLRSNLHCVHCQLLAENESHGHQVVAISAFNQMSSATWFLVQRVEHVATDVLAQIHIYRNWEYRRGRDGTELMVLTPMESEPEKRYIWKLTDEYEAKRHLRLGVWVD